MECKVSHPQTPPFCCFHYAHFLLNVMFTDIVNRVYTNERVYRLTTVPNSSVGKFIKVYNDIMRVTCVELAPPEFEKMTMNVHKVTWAPFTRENIHTVRTYLLERYPAKAKFGSVVLIQRGGRRVLIDAVIPLSASKTGSERREIKGIAEVHAWMRVKYPNMTYVQLEDMSMEDQVNLFHHASIIVCAHGAAMANMLVCKPNCRIVEVTCGTHYKPFNTIIQALNLKHTIVRTNDPKSVIDALSKT